MGNACHISKGKVKGKEQHVRPRPRRDDNIKNGLTDMDYKGMSSVTCPRILSNCGLW